MGIAPGDSVPGLKDRGDLEGLSRLLLGSDAIVRWEAADALAELGDPAAMDALIATFGVRCDGPYADRARGAVEAAMARLGPPASGQLRALIDIGTSGPWAAVRLIRTFNLVDDPAVGLWYRAATGEWEGADASRPQAMALILERLEQPSYWMAAVQGLRAAGAVGVPHLVRLLARDLPEARDPFAGSRETAALDALSRVDSPEAREAVARHFKTISAGSLDDKTSRCRDCLVVAGGEPALQALMEELSDSRPVRRAAAASALGRLGDRRALPALRVALDFDDDRRVIEIQSAPDNVTDDFLRESLQRVEERYPVREAAAAAIARLEAL